jgi:hypothetical protein
MYPAYLKPAMEKIAHINSTDTVEYQEAHENLDSAWKAVIFTGMASYTALAIGMNTFSHYIVTGFKKLCCSSSVGDANVEEAQPQIQQL